MKNYSSLALRISKVIRTSVEADRSGGLDDRELQMLEHVTREHIQGKRVLMDLDYLNIDPTHDSRQRALVPSKRALSLFDNIGKSISHILVA
jgi:hypothetical protein